MARNEVTIRQDGPKVLLIINGKALEMAPANARAIAAGLMHQAGKAEEIIERERIVFDQAILYRAGAGIGFIHDEYLQNEAVKEAAWNSDLRRYMPGGVKSQEKMGAPSITQTAPLMKGNSDADRPDDTH